MTADSRNEVRAVYGGFGIAMALLLTATLWVEPIRTGAFISVAIALFGMAAGRIVSAMIDQTMGYYPRIFVVVELILAALLVVIL